MTRFYFRYLTLAGMIMSGQLLAQEETTSDSTRVLDEIVIQAYRSDRPLSEVPAAIGVIGEKQLNRFSNSSLLPAVNMIPGVRMEERSPGSYRFSIRGSVLRSPFGVRNVKFYWKGLPLTDGGGNTYLNLLDFNSVGGMEIIKGPGASLYGGGTGGVVLLTPPKTTAKPNMDFSVLGGGYGLLRMSGGGTFITSGKSGLAMRVAYQKSKGYRDQTEMFRLVSQADWEYAINNSTTLSTTFLWSHLNYQTPGGLTRAQFEADPSQARPATPTIPGAVEQKAAVDNHTGYLATQLLKEWSDKWSSRIGIFWSDTDFENPTIRNFEKRTEKNWGGRTETQAHFGSGQFKGKFTFGGEFQMFKSPLLVYDNNLGTAGNLQTEDHLAATTGLAFLQTEFDLPRQFFLTLGGSANFLRYEFERVNVTPTVQQERKFDPGFFPRVALLKKFSEQVSLYGSLSNGFSAPSLAEVRPSTGAFNNSLNPEHGRNLEAGVRLSLLKKQIQLDASAYDFRLKETIVIQRAADGAEYFVNAGSTLQRGLEATVSWSPFVDKSKMRDLRFWFNATINNYHFTDYINDGNDFSNKMVAGVSPNILAGGIDFETPAGWYTRFTASYTDHIPMNDANTEFASVYTLLGGRLGKKQVIGKWTIDFFFGIDNALDAVYSLGNDLNAVGGRYYNAAQGRNFYGGVYIPIPIR